MDTQQTNNINASDLDKDTKEKLQGDRIGDTLYTESFVIKTLMKITALDCTEEQEQDLCFLWDMTMDKQVCDYLFKINFPSVVSIVLDSYVNSRFIEILIGILANTLIADCKKNINEEEAEIVLNQFRTLDPMVLIQILRFIDAYTYISPQSVQVFEDRYSELICQILTCSENKELIMKTMETLLRLTQDFRLSEKNITENLLKGISEGFETVLPLNTKIEDTFDNQEMRNIIKKFFNIVTNVCLYVSQNPLNEIIPTGLNAYRNLPILIYKVIKYFSEEKNLLPLPLEFDELIAFIQEIISTRDFHIIQNVVSDIFPLFCKILEIFYSLKSELLDSFNNVLELISCIVCLLDQNAILAKFKNVKYKRRIIVLNSLKENSKTFSFDISEKLRFLFVELK